MEGLRNIIAELHPILPGLITAVVFLIVLAALRMLYRGETITSKLRFPTVLFTIYLVLLGPVLFVSAYWPQVSEPLGILALFILALAIILTASFGLFDLFLGRYRKIHAAAIFRDIAVLVVYIITIFVLLGQHGVDLTSILTTSAVLTAVVGFALQDLLSNIIAGLALQIERPFTEGDFVMFGEQEGQILEINWRSTKVKTLHNDIVVIPNNVITKESVVNFSSPTRVHRRKFVVGLRYEVPPNKAKASILKAVQMVDGVLAEPEPYIVLRSYDDFSIAYRVFFYIDDLEHRERIEDEVRTYLWYQLKRDGLSIPFPIRDVFMKTITDDDEAADRERELGRVIEFLQCVPFLEPLSPEELRVLAAGTKREYYGARETVIRAGDEGDSFFIISEGEVDVCVGDELQVVANLKQGQFFGEMSLMTGEARSATIVTRGDCEFLIIDKPTFQKIVVSNEDLIADIGEMLESRRVSLKDAEKEQQSVYDRRMADEEPNSIVNKIRSFFNIRGA